MTQVSKRILDPVIEKRIYQIFVHVITEANTTSDVQALLNDFFTPTERVMLPKRLCIAFLLLKKYPHRIIASYLNVSFTTINKVNIALKTGGVGYTILLSRLQKIEQYDKLFKTIEEGIINILASAGGPSTVWKQLRSRQQSEKYNNRTPF